VPDDPRCKNTSVRAGNGDFPSDAVNQIVFAVERDHTASLTALPAPPVGVCQVYLTFTTRGYCGRKLFAGTDRCYWHSRNTEKYAGDAIVSYFGSDVTLRQALEAEVAAGRSLEMAFLVKARLDGSFVSSGCTLKSGIFVRADFRDAHLSYSDLQGANFCYAHLEGAYLSQCNIDRALFDGAKLFNTKFRNNTFAGVTGLTKDSFKGLRWGWYPIHHMLEEYPDQCVGIYRSLAAYFSSGGLFDDASWAAYRACIMRHRILTQRLSAAKLQTDEFVSATMIDPESLPTLNLPGVTPRRFSARFAAVRMVAFMEWAKSYVLKIVVGYGEKPLRVLWSALCTIFAYALIYKEFGAINDMSFDSCLYFSAITFTTVGYGDLAPHGAFRLVAASEALMGILLCGLFLFCLGRRSVSRA
jgi:uncharacterized protein YjbI with pentapeptide repeats